MRRVRVLRAAAEVVADLLRPAPARREIRWHGETHVVDNPEFEAYRCDRGLPEGARLVWAEFDVLCNELRLWFEHETFEDVYVGRDAPPSLPSIDVAFSRGDPRNCGFGHRCETCRMAP